MNLFDCLPMEVARQLLGMNNILEMRLRQGKGIRLNVGGKWFWLGKQSLSTSAARAVCFEGSIDDVVKRLCNGSVFAYEKSLAQGYFTLQDGTRIGVCGRFAEGVFQQYTSLCVRFPRYVSCAVTDFSDSVIVAGSPRSGKTTYVRDLACRLSQQYNVAVVDERGEISSAKGFEEHSNCDVFRFADKRYAFEVAVHSLSPDWIVCDELSETDLPLLEKVVASGVKLAATIHAEDTDDLKRRLKQNLQCFSWAVLLQKDTFTQKVVSLKAL